jgi:hypothetical protein
VTLLIKKYPPPYDHRRALGMVLLQGLSGALFLMSEIPLWQPSAAILRGRGSAGLPATEPEPHYT